MRGKKNRKQRIWGQRNEKEENKGGKARGKERRGGAGDAAQRFSVCLACVKPWIQSPIP
jgi:hypothetical protein